MNRLFATSPRGLEELLAEELRQIGVPQVKVKRGGVEFSGHLEIAYRACLWSRLANRVLLPIEQFEAGDDLALYEGVGRIDWQAHLGPEQTMAVDFTGVRAAITHSRFAEQRIKDAVVDQIRERSGSRPSVDTQAPDLRINVHMVGKDATVAIDLSGESLHRRGYRRQARIAPLKENLAAAMLIRAGWHELATKGGGFVDPMCGSGTLLIEAAWIATDTAPGLLRTRFGFFGWRGHDDDAWKDLIEEALERQERGMRALPAIVGFDSDDESVTASRNHLRRIGLSDDVAVERRDIAEATAPNGMQSGLVATNPPYGERLAERHELVPLYLRLGESLKRHFPGWRAIVLNGAEGRLGLKPEQSWQFFNGPLECRLELFEIGTQQDTDGSESAPDLVNRISKNQRHLAR
ncbi:MAG: THUMP domain-containing protein, partial [Wenzhouxiangella sp.]|nr:THUMP domain-containing protein [Wenzhouxiangella sp.]